MAKYIEINTASNVSIELRAANLWQRIAAYLLDSMIKLAYIIVFGFLFSRIGWIEFAIAIFFLPVMFYSFLFERFMNGQTPGKKALNIQVVNLTGEELTTGQILMRWLFYLIDIFTMNGIVALVVVAVTDQSQRVGDVVAGTSVIDLSYRMKNKYVVNSLLPDSYKPLYHQASELSSKQILVIKEVLSNKSENRFELITNLTKKIEEILLIEKYGSSETFLKQLLQDFQYFEEQKSKDLLL